MKHKKYIAILLLSGIAIVGLMFLWRGTGTFYHGHPLSWWVDRFGNSYPDQRNPKDVAALTTIGTNALPYLITWIRSADDKEESKRAMSAATAFSVLGTNANSSIPELQAILANPTNGFACVAAESALTRIGPDGFAAVMDVIATPGLPQRGVLMQGGALADHMRPVNAMTVVGTGDPNFRINSIRAAPVLLKCLDDNDAFIRRCAFLMLSYSDPEVMVPALTNFLAGSSPPAVRSAATQALAMHGTNALDAVPFLLSRYSNSDPEISIEASNALMQIAPDALAKGHP